MDGILWVLRTGAPWQDLPERYPSRATCHRRFQAWARDGTLEGVLKALAEDLRDRGGLELDEAFIDGSFASAKKGALAWVKQSAEKGPKIMVIADGAGLPLAARIASASPHEVTLAEATLEARFIPEIPVRLIRR